MLPSLLHLVRPAPRVTTRGGQFLFNGDREQEYMGVSATFNKRLANRWMLRGNFTWSDWEWSKIPDSSIADPTLILGVGQPGGRPRPPGFRHRLGSEGRGLH